VYNLSILSSVAKSILALLPEPAAASVRLRPLFTVGVMDIPELEQASTGGLDQSFVACTTDDVLASKPPLYDVLVLMPKSDSQNRLTRTFPQLILSSPELTKAFPKVGMRATQRDYHRVAHLLQGLRQFEQSAVAVTDSDTSSVNSHSSSYSTNKAVVEPSSWSRMAYTSLVWWVSAGDRRTGFAEAEEHEVEQDQALLRGEEEQDQTKEVAVVAYFHRMTAQIFNIVAAAIARTEESLQEGDYHDDVDNEDDASPAGEAQAENEALLAEQSTVSQVEINHEEMTEMGLDGWSASDKHFVEELTEVWFQRKAVVRTASIECCGLRIL